MVLRALYEYYHRSGNLPKQGLEEKQIGFILVITLSGDFLRIEDQRLDKFHARTFLVRKMVGRSCNAIANYLYDKVEYVLGYANLEKASNEREREKEEAKAKRYYQLFVEKTRTIADRYPDNEELQAVARFYEKGRTQVLEKVTVDPLWKEVVKNLTRKFSFFSFRIEGDDEIVAEKQDILNLDEDSETAEDVPQAKGRKKDRQPVCLITGKHGPLVETTTATPIPGSLSSAKLVSFQSRSGYDSYGKKKCANAPISVAAEFAYSTALKALLQEGSRNKFTLGDRTFVFWSSSTGEAGRQAEEGIYCMFGKADETADDPNDNVEQVRKTFLSLFNGELPSSLDDRFYILGLAPNAAREAIVYWSDTTLRAFADKILGHFRDMELLDTRPEHRPYQGARNMVACVTRNGKIADASPNLMDALLQSIFRGKPYPFALFAACIRRIRVGDSISITRAALIKAYLNRLKDNHKHLKIMLDKDNTDAGYLCGRLFAVVDKIQEEVLQVRNIRDSYLNAACAAPASVFATVLKLSAHHSAKQKEGIRIYFEKLKEEIIAKLPADGFPSHLDLNDQGRFFLGYYQQRQDFFVSRKASSEETADVNGAATESNPTAS